MTVTLLLTLAAGAGGYGARWAQDRELLGRWRTVVDWLTEEKQARDQAALREMQRRGLP